jgi:hypothetical protein
MVGSSWSSAFKTELRSAKMDKLVKNHARFCAKYVKYVGVGYTKRKTQFQGLVVNGEKFEFIQYTAKDLEIGDVVYIAKRVPTHKSQDYQWEIHQIKLAEAYWHYDFYERHHGKTAKERRITPYKPYVQTWFGSNTLLIAKL